MGEWRYSSTILYLCTRWASRPGLFNLRERTSSAHWIGGWVGPRTDLDAVSGETFLGCEDKDTIYFVSFNDSITNPDIIAKISWL
jgi:hypothetical protein